ncbi:hypothetical protein SAMN05421690_100634 [Nitrosomonas sp. Nm51]|uniref:Ig-like domain-containing protein n=1 Tax=Nitrosomonas sp. Nm51 TaxID=133720 RepID=UPI0008B81F64|nr:Ig-like domain-containing protein [Nitrosomonas sp. Nm51]SER03155.1 hypothetical protein SAMN05421690_100634 [Nitrosomonas sp. Nm51]
MKEARNTLPARMAGHIGFIIICIVLMALSNKSEANWKLSLDTEIASTLALAPENSWIKLNTNRYDDVWTPLEQRPAPPEAPAVGAPHSIIGAWSSMVWDPNRGNIMIYGGGHANYPGNEVYVWESSTLKWTRASLPSEVKHIIDGQFESIDGVLNAPVAAHTYDNSEFFPLLDRFVTFGGAAFNTGSRYIHTDGSPTGPYFFNPALADQNAVGGTTGSQVNPQLFPNVIGKNMWSNRDNLTPGTPGTILPTNFINTATAYSEENGVDVLYLQTNNRLFRYSAFSPTDPSQDTYEIVGNVQSGSTFAGQGAGAFDPQRKIFVRTAGSTFIFWDLNQPAGTIAQNVIFSPDVIGGAFNFSRLDDYGLDFDHIRQFFVLWDGNQDVWHLIPPQDLASGNWVLSRVTPQGVTTPQQSGTANPILGKWKYSKALDAFVGLFDELTGDIWVYKPTNWQPEVASEGVSIAHLKENEIIYANQSVDLSIYTLGKTISSVQYLLDGNVIGTSNAAPYTFEWIDRTPGTYALTASALFTDGSSAVSNPVNIVVSSDTIETIKLQHGLNEYTGTTDTYLDLFLSTSNMSENASLLSRGNGSIMPLVRFAIFESEGGPIPDGAIIRKADLSVYKYSAYDHVYGANRILSDWDGNTVTWFEKASGSSWNTPGANTPDVDFAANSDGEGSVEWDPEWLIIDVSSGVQDMSANGQNFGWKMVSKGGNNNIIKFHSSEFSNDPLLRPSLEIEYVSSSGPANFPPSISLTTPSEGAVFTEGDLISLTANANDTDGNIAKVEFYADDVLLGEDTGSPFEFSWSSATVGTHTLKAVAIDDKNKKTTSSNISITVNSTTVVNLPPTINLVSPVTGTSFQTGASISLSATADDSDGIVTKVAFYANGNLLGEVSSAPFEFAWTNPTTGTHNLNAIATDDNGATAASQISQVTVTQSGSGNNIIISLQQGLDDYMGTVDSYMYEYFDSVNYGENILLQDKINGSRFASVIRFAIFDNEGGPVPDGATITSAKISLFKTSFYDHVYRAHRILLNWSENDVTWEQRESGAVWNVSGGLGFGQDIADIPDGESAVGWSPGWLDLDVTSGVQAMSVTGQNHGWRLLPVSGNSNTKKFASSEYETDPALRPILEIEYIPDTGTVNLPPDVDLTAPSSGTEFIQGDPILLTANANDADGNIAKVEFYADDVLLGEDTGSPFEFSWSSATVGTHTLKAVAIDDKNKKTTSSNISITVNSTTVVNLPPTINLVSPVTGTSFQTGASISLSATADDSDGIVTKVAFYANGNLLGEVSSAPFEFAWTNPTTGTHNLNAIATDDNGATAASQISQVTVTQSGSGNNIIISLQQGLDDYMGTVDSYMYEYFDSVNYGENILLQDKINGSRFASVIRFAIFDNEGGPVPDGATITSAKLSLFKTSFYDHVYRAHRILLNWSENDVTWEQRESGAVWNVSGGLGFGQDIADIPDGESAVGWSPGWLDLDVTSGVQAMSVTGQNHGWRLLPVSGNSNTKKFASSEYETDPALRPILEIEYIPDTGTVNLPPDVDLTAPSSGTEFIQGDPILLTANASDPDGIITKVEFYADGVLLGEDTGSPYEFSWNSATAGAHTLLAVATDDDGKQATSLSASISVSNLINQPPTVTLTAPGAGAIFETGDPILITADANDSDGNITKVAFYANGALLGEVTQSPYEYSWLDATEGMHTLHVVATDDGALTVNSASVGIDVTQSANNGLRVTLQKGLNGFVNVWDSYLYEYHDFVNFGSQNKLLDKSRNSHFTSLIQFAIFESEGGLVPDQAIITSAKLKLYKSSYYDHVYRAHPLLLPWLEDQVTWQESQLAVFWDQPGATGFGTDIDSQYDGEASASWEPSWLIIDVTQGVQAIQNGRSNFGWKLVPVSGNGNTKTFVSSDYAEDATLRPALEIEYLLQE